MSNPVSRYISNVKKAADDLSSAKSAEERAKWATYQSDKRDSNTETVAEYRKRMAETKPAPSAAKNLADAKKKVKEEKGQLLGAVLQNRSYNENGTQKGHTVTRVDRKTGKSK